MKQEKPTRYKRKNLYDDINISERGINRFIIVVIVLLLVALYFGLKQ